MRAERLPDLVNQSQANRRSTSEASVTVTFDIGDIAPSLLETAEASDAEQSPGETPPEAVAPAVDAAAALEATVETAALSPSAVAAGTPAPAASSRDWSVTRRLRVTSQGTYTSNYFINSQPCTLAELHEQLQRFRIYPEGYNVVLQGDVTSIISMKPRERREIIDELAGVASFDRKIDQAKGKLDLVQEREERFRIVERELIDQLERLDQDRKKAEKYQQLKLSLQEKSQWQRVLLWRQQEQAAEALEAQLIKGRQQLTELQTQQQETSRQIALTSAELERCSAQVKALGEDEHLALQGQLATQEAELRQLERQGQTLVEAARQVASQLQTEQARLQTDSQTVDSLAEQLKTLREQQIGQLSHARDRAAQTLEASREATSAIANASQTWIEEQTQLRRQIERLLSALEPQKAEQVRLQERCQRLDHQVGEQTAAVQSLETELASTEANASPDNAEAEAAIQTLAQAIAVAEATLATQRETRERLLREQRQRQRELDKLEAQEQALQETRGTQATELLVRSGLQGICGLVAQLGRVDPKYQTALEIAAGARLGYLVVEHDGVAARGIDILKQQRAGRATFLPLNAIRPPRQQQLGAWERPDGLVDYAVNLIDCDDRYRQVFAFVFGNTTVFETLADARRHLGKFRMVTLEGEVLESSGAMTGGSLRRQGRLHFGTVEAGESEEAQALRQRLQDLERMIGRCDRDIATAEATVSQKSQQLIEQRQQYREQQLQASQVEQQRQQLSQRLAHAQQQQQQTQTEQRQTQQRLTELENLLPDQEQRLQQTRQQLADLEASQNHSEWQQAQAQVRALEADLSQRQSELQNALQQQQSLELQQQRLQEKITAGQQTLIEQRQQQQTYIQQQTSLNQKQTELKQAIVDSRSALAKLDKTLASAKAERDRQEYQLREQRNHLQQLEWQQQKLQETQQERQQQLNTLREQLQEQQADLPEPLPELPPDLTLETLQKQLKSLQRRIEALEPVNMLALEEYERTQERLEELTERLTTLEGERTELLLRIENFTTLRRQAFGEAFKAVNKNFQAIFAELSDGDGYLQLDDPQDPFNGGLNLVAHPKGKPVRRLASMSGGEKSLTALSFIFALQRYRPSPFYAFDEVDMFLDGANVERLSRMIRQQAQQAQFIVVSLRRPMIESAQRTIGVTQARGAYTQVLGINLQKATG